MGEGPAAVSLVDTAGSAYVPGDMAAPESYAILSKTGITNSGPSMITGNIATSPAPETYLTGFTLTDAVPRTYATAAEVAVPFQVFAADMVSPTPSNLTTAIGAMETAYTDAAGRLNPDYNEYMSGDLSGLTLAPGLYKWTNSVVIPTNLMISGSATDVWIFQIAGNLELATAKRITLAGGALAKNIYWQVAGQVDLLANSHFEGIILSKTDVNFVTNATMNGRVFSQTQVTLLSNTIVQP